MPDRPGPRPIRADSAEPPGAAGPLAESELTVFSDFAARVELRGARVAEIGGQLPEELARSRGVAAWYSLDPRHTAAGAPPGRVRRVLAARAEAIPLASASVDAVFSSNAFQFVDVPATLAEARRILRPGGLLYAHFGPIWSGPDGHQLEYVQYQGRDLIFWRDTLLPAWSHLRYSRQELRALLRSALPADLADLLVWHVHDSPTVNRLFFEDYVVAALRSGLEWLEVSASSQLDYEIRASAYETPAGAGQADEPPVIFTDSGDARQLGIRDVRMVLRQPGRPAAPSAVS